MTRSTATVRGAALIATLVLSLALVTTDALADPANHFGEALTNIPLDCNPAELAPPHNQLCKLVRRQEGRRLFTRETFGGNGRTCQTCHSRRTGTFSPEDALRRLTRHPDDPLFVHDGLDDGISGTARILQHATVRLTLPLPSNISLKHDPGETHVVFNRGTPTTINTPALDPVLMYDLRNEDLPEQALGAINGHAQNLIEPTTLQLELIAEFQQTARRFFSNPELRRFAAGGPAPELPKGRTAAEKRGRLFFVDAPFEPPGKVGVCGLCHSGPMLNEANVFSSPVFGNPPGVRAHNVAVSERNLIGNPLYTFLVGDALGPPVEVTTPDLGMLITDNDRLLALGEIPPDFVLAQLGIRRAFFANFFKIPTLWGIKHTAPYFHDNSAKDLDEMLEHYNFFFAHPLAGTLAGQIELTAQDKKDIKAFLKLL
jgi:cytochrome c peroxidase